MASATTSKTGSATSSAKKTTTGTRKTTAAAKPATTAATKPPAATKTTASTTPRPSVVASSEMRKRELIDKVVEQSGVRKKFAKPVVEAMLEVLGQTIAEGRGLTVQPLGKVMIQRSKDAGNARVTIAKIRQSKAHGPGTTATPKTTAGSDNKSLKEKVADPVE